MEHDLTITCTVILPKSAILSEDKRTFFVDSEEYVLNTITFSSVTEDKEGIISIADLLITDVADTIFEKVSN